MFFNQLLYWSIFLVCYNLIVHFILEKGRYGISYEFPFSMDCMESQSSKDRLLLPHWKASQTKYFQWWGFLLLPPGRDSNRNPSLSLDCLRLLILPIYVSLECTRRCGRNDEGGEGTRSCTSSSDPIMMYNKQFSIQDLTPVDLFHSSIIPKCQNARVGRLTPLWSHHSGIHR